MRYVTLVLVFCVNPLLFVTLGQEIGRVFRRRAPLKAYNWDLLGSLLGTLLRAFLASLLLSNRRHRVRHARLGLPFDARLAWALFAVPSPVFFAGLIFSTTFRDASDAGVLFGANLLGATIGGFCEYLGMSIGTTGLLGIVAASYSGSWICRLLR